MVGSMLENAALFATFGYSQCVFGSVKYLDDKPLLKSSLSGAIGGVFVSFILTPIELVKCKLQIQTDSNIRYTGTINCFYNVLREEGVTGLYKGYLGTFLRESVGCAWFGTYDYATWKMTQLMECDRNDLSPSNLLFAGSLSGIAYNLIMFPADVVKSRIQTVDGNSTFSKVFMKLYKSEGVSGLFRGCGITLLRSIPTSACMFLVYESCIANLSGREF
jgi:hypothetical protein